jgi:molybdenum cofactor cytidylyltransferase
LRVVPAVILASGQSKRMGRSKALLPCRTDETFVCRIARTLRTGGAHDVFIVGRVDDAALRAEAARCDARFVENARADLGQLSSILAGLDAVDHLDLDGVLVMPVDMPLVSPDTIRSVIAAFLTDRPAIARAVHNGRHGHPVVFGPSVFEDLRRADPGIGAKAVLHAHAGAVLDVEVDDPAILRDVDTPEDYRAMFP